MCGMDMMQGIASSVKRICFVGRIITAWIINPGERAIIVIRNF